MSDDADLHRLVEALYWTPMADGKRLGHVLSNISIMNILLEMTEGLGLHIVGQVGKGRFGGVAASRAAAPEEKP